MSDEQINTQIVEPTNPPTVQQTQVPSTPAQQIPVVATPQVRVEQPPVPLIQVDEPKRTVDIQKKAYAFVLPAGTTDDDKQSFSNALEKAKKEGAHIVVRSDVKVVEL